jgi:chromosome segregation protein
MYLSKLELQGFKSFADRTVLHFDPGITAIVGPNGCGKSNLVDAVRWVIGEQRARVLRSERMEHVIFNGTARRKPVGMAEVLLTVENTRGVLPLHYSEVTIGRRLYRSGESEYLLNGTVCRLRDIQELFMDTGMGAGAYSVIELKMIEEILSENAQDRRHLFEEAAGITRYKLRRTQTLRRLEATQNDLMRLRDVIEEVQRQVDTLKRQADRAERYRRYREALRTLEQTLLRHDYEQLHLQINTLTAELQEAQHRLQEIRIRYAALEAEQEMLRQQLAQTETSLEATLTQQRKLQRQLQALEGEIQLLDERLSTAQREKTRLEHELQEAQRLETQLQQTLAATETALQEVIPIRAQAEAELQKALQARETAQSTLAQHQTAVQQARRQLQQAEQTLHEAQRQLDRLNNRREFLEQERQRIEAEQEALNRQRQTLEAQQQQLIVQREAAQQQREALNATLIKLEAEQQQLQAAYEVQQQELHQVERRREAVLAEMHLLEGVLSDYEAFPDAVPFLARTPGWSEAPLETVADVLGIAPELQAALEAALAERATWIVVSTRAEAQQALALLRNAGKGRATFVVLENLPYPPPSPSLSGLQPLIDHVRLARPELHALAALLLHNAYLVADLESAHRAAQAVSIPARFVTPAGEWVDSRGWWHGGSAQSPRTAVSNRFDYRERLTALRQEKQTLEEALHQRQQTIRNLAETLHSLPLAPSRKALQEAERTLGTLEHQLLRLNIEREALLHRYETLQQREHELSKEQTTLAAALKTYQEAVHQAESDVLQHRTLLEQAEGQFRQAETAYHAALEQLSQTQLKAAEARNRHQNLEREHQQLQQRLDGLRRRQQELNRQLAQWTQRLRDDETQREATRQEYEALAATLPPFEAELQHLRTQTLEQRAAIERIERQLRELRRSYEDEQQRAQQHDLRLTEARTRLAGLQAYSHEHLGIETLDQLPTLPANFDARQAREEIETLRRRLETLGAVNELALTQYEEEKARLDFLLAQQQDLESAQATLQTTIGEINQTAVKRFLETFETIRRNFQQLFRQLFGEEAAADLKLVDPADPLESPIEILARPRGKRPSTLAQLSSGEKALTALALLFALYLTKPSPFCILDEVDAPLDEANIERFMNLLRSFSDNTQFILVTHNLRTMELADRLYGVTMQEPGVSTLVSVRLQEAAELVGR